LKENEFIKRELVKLIIKRKCVPKKIYFCKNGNKSKLCRDLFQVSTFLGISYNTAVTYSSIKKNCIGSDKRFFKINSYEYLELILKRL